MNDSNLNDVLEEYALATPAGNDSVVLRRFIEEHPQFTAELEDFAAARSVLRYASEVKLTADEEMRYQKIGLQNFRAVLDDGNTGQQMVLQSLTDTAKAKGLNRSKFAAAIGLSVSLVQYLEKRRLDFASIPNALISKVAEILETSEQLVTNYLNQPSIAATNTSYKSSERPEEMKPKNFAEAVREDQQLSSEEKRRLLEL